MKAQSLQLIAESYVGLVLAVGQHDADYVDAFYGPPQFLEQVKAEKKSLETIKNDALSLSDALHHIDTNSWEEIEKLRHQYLSKQNSALLLVLKC